MSETALEMREAAIRVLIADDHPVVLEGLVALLSHQKEIAVIATATNGREAVQMYSELRPDVTLLDLRMPGVSGLQALEAIREIDTEARVLVLTTFDGDENIYRAIHGGARGYLLKEAGADDIVEAVLAIHAGRRYIPDEISGKLAEHIGHSTLTKRETEVLNLAARGKKNKQIAAILGLTEGTVKGYFNNILLKLAAHDRTEAVTIAASRGIIRIDRREA